MDFIVRVLISIFIFIVIYPIGLARAGFSGWNQSNWGGATGQSVWSDSTRYLSASGLVASSTGLSLALPSGWYGEAWQYRQAFTVTNNSGTSLSNYQLPVYLDTNSLIATGKLTSDCRDLRISDSAGVAVPYWIATAPEGDACGSSSTKIWIKVSALPTGATTLYIYYGNSSALSASSGTAVFQAFADFTNASALPAGWVKTDIGTSGTATVGSGVLTISNTNGEDVWNNIYGGTHVYPETKVSGQFIAEAVVVGQANTSPWAKTGITVQNTIAAGVGNGQAFIIVTPENGIAYQYQSAAGSPCVGGCTAPNVQENSGTTSFPMFLRLKKDGSGSVGGYFSTDGRSWSQRGSSFVPQGAASDQYVTLMVTPHNTTDTGSAAYALFYTRSYAATEPVAESPHDEEGKYTQSGSLTSSVYDTGAASDFGNVQYARTLATGTALTVKVRTGNSTDLSDASAFADCNAITAGAGASTGGCAHNHDRYAQYQVSLSGDSFATPTFISFSLANSHTPVFQLSYSGGTGSIQGSATQSIYSGDNGTAVTAAPPTGYHFVRWSDDRTDNPRTDEAVSGAISVTAVFEKDPGKGSTFTPSVPAVTVVPNVVGGRLEWTASNVKQIAVSQQPDFSATSWEDLTDNPIAAPVRLYVKFRSVDGGESSVYIIDPPAAPSANGEKATLEVPTAIVPVAAKSPSPSVSFLFRRDLKLGMQSPDVQNLQRFLNAQGFVLAGSGIGSPGKETTYFGNLTKAALSRFQKARGISPASGFFGPATRKIVNIE